MKLSVLTACLSLSLMSVAQAQVPRDNSNRPCIDANVQINQSNTARVNQNCKENMSATMQAGQVNTTETRQRGERNDNTVEQMNYEGPQRRPAPRHGQ